MEVAEAQSQSRVFSKVVLEAEEETEVKEGLEHQW